MRVTQTLSAVLVVALTFSLARGAFAQTIPTAQLERKYVLVDKKDRPKKIIVEFIIKTDFVVQEARLFYKSLPDSTFKNTKLKLSQDLLYIAEIPPKEVLNYYIRIRSEKGDESYIGSREETFRLVMETLARLKGEKRRKRFIILSVFLAIVAALSVGGAVGKK